MKDFPFGILRPGSPTEAAFAVAEVPHRAKLDQNESPMDLPEDVKARILEEVGDLPWNHYPQPKEYATAKERFARAIGQKPENIILTVGGDQLILLAYWAAGGAGRRARIFEPTYPMIAAFGRNTNTSVDSVVLGSDFLLEEGGLGDQVDLIVLVSPNNPTGNCLGREVIHEALDRECLVLVDEAYGDYAGRSVVDLVEHHPNLLVARSLSKALLAGARLGYGVGHPDLIGVLERLIFSPYHLNHLQLALAGNYHLVVPHLEKMVAGVVSERQRLQKGIASAGGVSYPSEGNFVMFEVGDAAGVYNGLLDRGVRIRDISSLPGMGEHLRVTVGTPGENDLFLEALGQVLR